LTAEELRKNYGVDSTIEVDLMSVAGRNLRTRVPEQKKVSRALVRAAMKEPITTCTREILSMLERTPPEVQRTIRSNGIYLVGGTAGLKGMKSYMENALGIKVHTMEQPELCAVNGLKKIIESKELMNKTYSMLDENYRWMR